MASGEGYPTQFPALQDQHPGTYPLNPGQPEPQTAQSPGGYPPPAGAPPTHSQPNVQIPGAAPGFPAAAPAPGYPGANPFQTPYFVQQPTTIVYNGASAPNPDAPPAVHGARKVPTYDPAPDYEVLKGAKKGGGMFGSGWNDDTLSKIFVARDPFQIDALSDYFGGKLGQTLVDYLPAKTKMNSWFYGVIHALALGPVGYDVELAKNATKGIGTNETLLMELLLNRSNNDIEILKRAYTKRYGSSLVEDVRRDLSNGPKTLYSMALMAQRPQEFPGQLNYPQVEKDVEDLNSHGLGRNSQFNETFFCEIFVNRSDAHIAAVIDRYGQKYKSLSKVIKNTTAFSKDVKAGLVYIIHGVKSKRNKQEPFGAWRDAKLMYKAMVGAGTNDEQLVYRVVRASWNNERMRAIKVAYSRRYGKELTAKVKSETSGVYQKLMMKLIERAN